ncbi:MAG: pilus assembly protein PilB [Richelia sp. RM2_1_2]|nr:pilus assembly protein PilB [Richelia sp. SM2_1_7]NJM18957.1 pilus assembly protein PilB [Richelia sp. SM1_7_0]NJN07409.1 pilus assembly protein PilB [Richelia sp. RM1_1_1]NJO26791.1 pilus assembly protein PilB [Richelia sp. SL_2_1]NJO57466.1 pilus assembly protein PilB [Richelia sp. RM2_1_2]
MLSSEGKPTDTSAAIANQKRFKTIGTDGASSLTPNQQEQIFQLIESILCFEACLYHQVLPLKLEDNNLLLGIVNPTDAAALDYVNSILSYLKSTLQTQPLTAETHRIILSEYLNYKNRSAQVSKLASNQGEEVENQSFLENLEEEFEPGDNTLILFDFPKGVDLESFSHIQEPKKAVTTPLNRQELDENIGVGIFEVISADNLPALRLPLPESFSADAVLSTLAPKKLLKELLARILAGGIGRLYLERQPYQGRILWSLNGIVQSVIEELPLSTFQGVLNELKRLNSLKIATLGQAKQVETECLFQQQRLLLRLRVMPGMYGEEATLQVLRGAALKFYQQQQLTRLSRDALGASQQLSYKVHELQQKLALNRRELNPRQLEALNALNELVETLDSHLRILTDVPTV